MQGRAHLGSTGWKTKDRVRACGHSLFWRLCCSFIAGAFGLYGWHNSFFATTDDAEIDGNLYTIAAQIGGRVAQVQVDDNQHVSAGQILVQLDDRDQRVALLKARLAWPRPQAELAQDQAQVAECGRRCDRGAE